MDEAERLCDRVAIIDHGEVIALGTPRELIASIGVEHVVEFSTGGSARADRHRRVRSCCLGVRDARACATAALRVQATELHERCPRCSRSSRGRVCRSPSCARTRRRSRTSSSRSPDGICAMSSDASPRSGLRSAAPAAVGILGHPLVQLTLVRIREFMREPEAVFWAIFFPILLTTGLGIAFRSRPPEVLAGRHAPTPALAAVASQRAGPRRRDLLSADAAPQALRIGKVALVAEPRPAAASPIATTTRIPKDARPRAAGGRAPSSAPPAARIPVAATDALVREPGSRYIDFLVPGLVGLGIMSNAVWGIGFSIVDAPAQADQAARWRRRCRGCTTSASYLVWRMLILVVRGRAADRLRRAGVRRAGARAR